MNPIPIVDAAGILGLAIVFHGIATTVLAALLNPRLEVLEPLNPEFDPMPVIGPDTEAIIETIRPRIQAAIVAGVSSSLAAISSSQADVASSLAAQDDADTASAIDSALTGSGATPVAPASGADGSAGA